MYFLKDLCYICFDTNDKLKDILKLEEESIELFAKLTQLIAEVEWSTVKKLLLCEKCIKKLNTLFKFKKQCIDSSEAIKLFLSLEGNENHEANKYIRKNNIDREIFKKFMLIQGKSDHDKQNKSIDENNAITKLSVSNTNNPNSYQNVFLNILPTVKNIDNNSKSMLINLNQLYQFESQNKKPDETSFTKILNTTRTEEVSVEINPLDFTDMDEDEGKVKDWDEIILNTQNNNDTSNNNTYKPIVSKLDACFGSYTNEEKMDFFNSGHFLLQDTEIISKIKTYCDKCGLNFKTIKLLNLHIKEAHSTDFPYKCEHCNLEFADLDFLQIHIKQHSNDIPELIKNSITLNDFDNKDPKINDLLKIELNDEIEDDTKCDVCPRKFLSVQGLLNHRAKKHRTSDRKKYFVKGMKNAKCDICNRMFSTNSYLNLHKKLHDRKGEVGMKIFKSQEEMDTSEIGNKNDEIDEESEIDDIEEDKEMNKPEKEEKQPSIKLKIRFKDIEQMEDDGDDEEEEEEQEECISPILSEFLETSLQENKSINELRSNMDLNESLDSNDSSKIRTETEGKPKCSYCQKLFGRKHDLKRHIKNVHLKTVQYKCHLCDKIFYEGFHLTRHLRSHCSIICKDCDRVFFYTSDLKNHLISEHDNTGSGYCGLCMEDFVDLSELNKHNDEHLQTIKYKCHICPEEFNECRVLSRHLMEHYQCLNYTCNICKIVLPNESELIEHVAHHSPRFQCDICLTTYKKKRYLQQHIRNNHAIEQRDVEVIIDRADDASDDSS